jgi:hypothetical protein
LPGTANTPSGTTPNAGSSSSNPSTPGSQGNSSGSSSPGMNPSPGNACPPTASGPASPHA